MDHINPGSNRGTLTLSDGLAGSKNAREARLKTEPEMQDAIAHRWAFKHLCREIGPVDHTVIAGLEQILSMPPAQYQNEREARAQSLGWDVGTLDDAVYRFEVQRRHELAKLAASTSVSMDKNQPITSSARQKFAEAALQIVADSGAIVWTSREGKAFITASLKSVTGHYCLEAKSGENAIRSLLNAQAGLFTTKDQLADVIDQLVARAKVSDDVHDVCLRTADVGGVVYLDLGSSSGRVVRVDDTGRSVIEMRDCPARFWRPAGMLPMPEPSSASDHGDFLDRIRDYANIPGRTPLNESSDLLHPGIQADVALLMALPSWIRRSGVVPHLALSGRPGSGKTTVARLLRNLVDPQAADVLRPRGTYWISWLRHETKRFSFMTTFLRFLPRWRTCSACWLLAERTAREPSTPTTQ
jgi:hypothetical protein